MALHDKRPIALVIIDGWGVSESSNGNAISAAHTPYYDQICSRYPASLLSVQTRTAAPRYIDPAEIGHRVIGSGRTSMTDPEMVEAAVLSGKIGQSGVLKAAYARTAERGSALHFIGLLSDGGIHSSPETLFALLRAAKRSGVREAFVHGILDGLDVSARTADVYVEAVEIKMADIGIGKFASVCGRFYGMDLGGNWERTARAYTMLVHGEGERTFDPASAIRASFLRGISDEFVAPIVVEKRMDEPVAVIKDGDVVVFFNHNGEGIRQLVRSLAVPDPTAAKPKIDAICLTKYDASFGLPVVLLPDVEANVTADLLESRGVRNYRITESSRSGHISGFFNGRSHSPGEFERNIFIEATGRETADMEPESKSFKIADALMRALDLDPDALFVANFPAPAMAAEAGNFERTVESIQFVDTCLGGIVEKFKVAGGALLITASHAGCESMNETSAKDIFVPFHLVDPEGKFGKLEQRGRLQDVAPTLLGLLGIEKPAEMTGRDLRIL